MSNQTTTSQAPASEVKDEIVVRFAGDSGDGMQLAGDRFTIESAVLGNDLVTFPNYPAEIRAPAGTLAGVSSFQVHFSDHEVLTPGDRPTALVAMNPAALLSNVNDLDKGAMLIVNEDAFDERNLKKAGYSSNPLEDDTLADFKLVRVPMTRLTVEAAKGLGAKGREAQRSKNFFALGFVSWMFTRPIEPTIEWTKQKFGKSPSVVEVNLAALKAGYNFAETAEVIGHRYDVPSAQLKPGTYRSIQGNPATAYGLIAAAHLSKLPLLYASYPITPASDILHELARHKNFGVRTLQAEDEIAAICMAIGASFAGQLGVTATSGPGVALKGEALGLALHLELPLVLIDVQRGGPSTGLPTKTEQSDLLMAMFGRHGDSPVPVLAAQTPSDCFYLAMEAVRITTKYMTPVILLTDGYLANGSEPWLLPNVEDLPEMPVHFATAPNHVDENDEAVFWPYLRDENLSRPWGIPGTPGLEHRIGGLEKQDGTGNISYDPDNHQYMVLTRVKKVQGIANDIPPLEVNDPTGDAELLVVSWGSTFGAVRQGVCQAREKGAKVAHAHFRYLNPFPANTAEVLRSHSKILVPEMNTGHLLRLLRADFLVDAQGFNKIAGLPFMIAEIEAKIWEMI